MVKALMNCVRKNVEYLWENITKHIMALPSGECERALHGKERGMKLFEKFIYLISADIRNSKIIDLEHNVVDRFTLNLHNFVFILFLVLAILFYGDIWLFDASISSSLIDWFGLLPENKKYLHNEQIKMFYTFGGVAALAIGVIASVYFYISHGADIDRYDLHKKLYFNNLFITTIISFIGAPLLTVVYFSAGYLVAIKFPAFWSLDQIPGFLVIQLIVAIKMLAYTALGACGTGLMFFPYRLHPKKLIKKENF